MSVHMITYDLNQKGQNYSDVIDEIKSFDEWSEVMQSCWFVATGKSIYNTYSRIKQHIDNNDILFVVKVEKENYQGFINTDTKEWLRKHR